MKLNRESGFSIILTLITLLVIGAIGVVAWRIIDKNNSLADTNPIKPPIAYQKNLEEPVKPLRVVAVGDIVCEPGVKPPKDQSYCQSDKTYQLVKNLNPDIILGLGDLQYSDGTFDKFKAAFDKNWGKLTDILYPSPGNHEYYTSGAKGYYRYFKDKLPQQPSAAIETGYYSFNDGGWHFISLNSNCQDISCSENSRQVKWLKNDFSTSQQTCTIAYWHHPHFTSGKYSDDLESKNRSIIFWQKLYQNQADIVLNGHDHIYERFAPQTPGGQLSKKGIGQFTVGTGGKSHYRQKINYLTSRKVVDDQFGVLELSLGKGSYSWKFISIDNKILDSGNQTCH